MFHLANKIFLLGLLLIPLILLWQRWLEIRGRRFIAFSSRSLLVDGGRSFKVLAARHLGSLKIAALALVLIALARPQILHQYRVEKKMGIDILITLDVSGSMASIDFKPKDRLEVAKEVIAGFIEKRTSDRIGLVIFAGTSYTRCPLTVDYDILRHFLEQTKLGELEDGTAIGMALATSINRIRHSKARTRIIILLTDGVNNRGEIDPLDAIQIAKDFQVKIYTIGVGTRGKAPLPVVDSFGQTRYIMWDVEIDEALLQKIANETGGLYFRATDKDSLQQIFGEIDRWEKTEISSKKYSQARDIYHYFLALALLLLLIAETAKRSFLRILP